MKSPIETICCALPYLSAAWFAGLSHADDIDTSLAFEAERARIEMIERAAPAVVCVFDEVQRGGGSGVLIDPDGYGLTNYHVVAGMLETRRGLGGLSDGRLYELEVLGIDPTGDVAMFRLSGRDAFPHVPLGDSDAVRIGDTAIAMGNPFMVSEDYKPTVTMGIVTGVHRYQWGQGRQLVYSDCIQMDTPINPGNSGGPLFNAAGEVIGINGRISVNTRGRFNVGFGYAISANQIKRFIPALRAGLVARHGTLQATVDDIGGEVIFDEIMRDAPAYDAGIRIGDRLLSFDGIPIRSANHFASLLGTYPEAWPVPIEYARGGQRLDTVARLEPLSPRLETPFEADREVNLRQVRRVLRTFQETVFGAAVTHPPEAWSYELSRRDLKHAKNNPESYERYRVSLPPRGPAQIRRMRADAAPGPAIEYDATTALRRSEDNADAFELAPDERMALATRYIVERILTQPIDQIHLSDVAHAGGDALIEPDHTQRGFTRRLLEVLEWPVAQTAVARLGFDANSGRLMQAVVRDRLAGIEVTVRFTGYRDVGGVNWPCEIRVESPGLTYEDSISKWTIR
ncbi:MAG: trypsin-like peptidase domain-containing protein [Phycisphaerales bacterium]|nr:MAG: trypsin-like peptidase domain-containing protein [Phycisphaerales bacterium]